MGFEKQSNRTMLIQRYKGIQSEITLVSLWKLEKKGRIEISNGSQSP